MVQPLYRVSMAGDLLSRQMPLSSKVKWLLILIFIPLGAQRYHEKIYGPAYTETQDHSTMKTSVAANRDLNNLHFYAGVVALIFLLGVLAFVAIRLR